VRRKFSSSAAVLPLGFAFSFCHGAASEYQVLIHTWENSHSNIQNA